MNYTDIATAARRLQGVAHRTPVLTSRADVVIECAPAAVYDEITGPAVRAGRIVVTMSSGVLLSRPDLLERAKETGARIIIPSGGESLDLMH